MVLNNLIHHSDLPAHHTVLADMNDFDLRDILGDVPDINEIISRQPTTSAIDFTTGDCLSIDSETLGISNALGSRLL